MPKMSSRAENGDDLLAARTAPAASNDGGADEEDAAYRAFREEEGNPHSTKTRQIRLNGVQSCKFMSNYITTAKYNFFSFLPKFLFEQFRRYANVFFLGIGLMQQIPDVSPTGRYVTIIPFSVILGLTAIKELIEDAKRHRADSRVNSAKTLVYSYESCKFEEKKWKDVAVGDILKVENGKFFPSDLVLMASSEPQGMCYVETSNLDGETNLKIRSAISQTACIDTEQQLANAKGSIMCELPNRNLYEFNGNLQLDPETHVAPLTPSSVLLRGAKLMNTGWIYGVVIYTGHETKLLMNSTQAPLKRSNIDKITNYQIIFLFIILIVMSLASAIGSELLKNNGEDHSYVIADDQRSFFFFNFLTFIILYNNLIPISLQVTLEFVKFLQAYFVNWDEDMYHEETQTYAMARTSNLNEELGQIKYVFSDKTGTLTQNVMEFKESSVGGIKYRVPDNSQDEKNSEMVTNLLYKHDTSWAIENCLVLMSVCHTVIPESEPDGGLKYNASSPDEKALVEGAALYGYKFAARKPHSVIIDTSRGESEEYQVMNVIEFTSTRKRMSIVVRTPDGKIKMFMKGADSVIMERLGESTHQRQFCEATMSHLGQFASAGLRTLCLAMREIPEDAYEKWNKKFHQATIALNDREEQIDRVAALMENDLTLLGATAIEDKLQDGVPDTIAQLLEAHIHVWVLTGDKQETAINIGHSCRLLKDDVPIIILNTSSLDETRAEILTQLTDFRDSSAVGEYNEVSIVIDGKSLIFAMDHSLRKDFIELCCSCSSVICCRVSPIQKAEMVELVQEHTSSISLAIGDGANDVAMIQKAHVGVGISGNEGLQAANSSDFAIAQFRFLSRLLFVHGAWNYSRIAKVILYSFYKNICLYIIELWFALYSYWSGQVLFERWTIGLYNLFMTGAPPIAIGLFDQNCSASTRLNYPVLYRFTQKSEFFNHKVFWRWIGNSVFHSMILFWMPMLMYTTGVVWSSGYNGDYLVLGNVVYSCVEITVCLKAGIEMDSWNWVTHLAIWGSMAFWFVFLATYSYYWVIGLGFAANMAGMIQLVVQTPMFWLSLLLVPLVALLPDIAVKTIGTTMFTTETEKIRIAEIMQKDVSVYIPPEQQRKTRSRLHEATHLLRSVREVFSKRGNGNSNEDIELNRGYAFSQEEGGAISQAEYITRYDTTRGRRSNNDKPTRISGCVISGDASDVNTPLLEEDEVDSSSSAVRKESSTSLVVVKVGVLESPRKAVITSKTSTNKNYAQSEEEIVPLKHHGSSPKK